MSENNQIRVRDQSASRTPTPRKSITLAGVNNNGKNDKSNTYFNLISKSVFLLLAIFLIFIVFKSISDDVWSEIGNQENEYSSYIERCKREYAENKCDDVNFYPHLHERCLELKSIINKPPPKILKSKIAVRYFATLLNELINPLSPKTVILFALIVVFVVWIPKFF